MNDSIFEDYRIIELKKYTDNIGHCDKTLFDHLYGTYKILKDNNRPEYLCFAAFFHSVYETEYFQFETPYTREKVKSLIGEQAELLVYEFCKMKPRINALIARSGEWPDDVYADLLDIELANMIEQKYYNQDIKIIEAIRTHLGVNSD